MDPLEREEIIKQRDYYVWKLTQNLPRLLAMLCRQRIAQCNSLLAR